MPIPAEPKRALPKANWKHYDLYGRVGEALRAAPSYFESRITITGISAADIFAFNSALGTTIEQHVVETLNRMRPVWDPDEKYSLYSFVRQSQTFPDVLFRKKGEAPILGIELKGWYLLAREGEASFRYSATPKACAKADLLVVYPWYLSEVISGKPVLLEPFIEPSRYVAEYRNWFWEHKRATKSKKSKGVVLSTVTKPYPTKSDEISDKAEADGGGNFGRIARVRIMDDFNNAANQTLLAGIPADMWRKFLVLFKDGAERATIEAAIARLKDEAESKIDAAEQDVEDLVDKLRRLAVLLK